METDIRWKQRFGNFCRAFGNFSAAVELARSRPLSELEKQGLIQSFEFTQDNNEIAEEIASKSVDVYYACFLQLKERLGKEL